MQMAREPGYCKHKATGQAYVNFRGKVIYLGSHGSEESKERYNRLKAEWLVNRHSEQFQPTVSAGPFIADICLAFLEHAERYYSQSNECAQFELAVQPLSDHVRNHVYRQVHCGSINFDRSRSSST